MEFESYFQNVSESSAWLKKHVSITPRIAVILSAGLGKFADLLENPVHIKSSDIPHFPEARAEGHKGTITFGTVNGVPVVALAGRFHYYEGHLPQNVVFPLFVLAKMGAKVLVATNASGGINRKFKAGDLMMVTDHINMMGINPLVGIALRRSKDQFTDMTSAYDLGLQKIAERTAKKIGINLKKGVYVGTSGPNYETRAETRAFRIFGADAVGMSTVPEVIAANFLGMRVLTLSCIANPAADLHKGNMSHKEVLDAMQKLAPRVVKLLKAIIEEIK